MILHAFLALAAGFATMALLVIVLTALLTRLVPSWTGAEGKPQPGYVFVNLGYSFLAAAAGGYVTAWAAAANPLYSRAGAGDGGAGAGRAERAAIAGQAADLVCAGAGGDFADGRAGRGAGVAAGGGNFVDCATCIICATRS